MKPNKLKSGIKNGTQVIISLSLNVIDNSNDGTNLLHKLLLTDTQVSKICKAFANGLSANKKFSKTQPSKLLQLCRFLDVLGEALVGAGEEMVKRRVEKGITIVKKVQEL